MSVIKVQRALAGVQYDKLGQELVLVYDKYRKHQSMQPLTPELRRKLKDDMKAYFSGRWSSIVGWAINQRIEDQS